MKYFSGIIVRLGCACLLLAVLTVSVVAQETRQERAANLRAQLAEVQAKQTELQTRLQQIEEEIKPESIERSLAGIGSTHPEDLREQRRRQLEIEKKGLQSQLDTLAASRARLETAIAAADAISYQTGGPALAVEPLQTTKPTKASSVTKKPNRPVRRRARRAVRKLR
jgi:cell division protein FtsB